MTNDPSQQSTLEPIHSISLAVDQAAAVTTSVASPSGLPNRKRSAPILPSQLSWIQCALLSSVGLNTSIDVKSTCVYLSPLLLTSFYQQNRVWWYISDLFFNHFSSSFSTCTAQFCLFSYVFSLHNKFFFLLWFYIFHCLLLVPVLIRRYLYLIRLK